MKTLCDVILEVGGGKASNVLDFQGLGAGSAFG